MNWKIQTLQSTDSSLRFSIANERGRLNFQQVLDLLENSPDFIQFYKSILIHPGYEAFFWEHPPVTHKTLDQLYECNLINSPILAGKNPDLQSFGKYFRDDKEVVSFMNLGGDAELIAPCPTQDYPGYAHIGEFLRNAPEKQIEKFWKLTAQRMINATGGKPKWLSTSGLGVFWLHVRIDSRPKYYQTDEYKRV